MFPPETITSPPHTSTHLLQRALVALLLQLLDQRKLSPHVAPQLLQPVALVGRGLQRPPGVRQVVVQLLYNEGVTLQCEGGVQGTTR